MWYPKPRWSYSSSWDFVIHFSSFPCLNYLIFGHKTERLMLSFILFVYDYESNFKLQVIFDILHSVQFSSVQSLSRVQLFATPWTAARQASMSITNSRSLLRLMSIESVMPSSHLIFCRPLLLLPPTPPSIKVFSNESTLRMRWP